MSGTSSCKSRDQLTGDLGPHGINSQALDIADLLVILLTLVVVDRFYSAILRSQADSLPSHVILHERLALSSAFLNIHQSGVLKMLAWLMPHETAARLARSVYTIQPCTMSLHANHILLTLLLCLSPILNLSKLNQLVKTTKLYIYKKYIK